MEARRAQLLTQLHELQLCRKMVVEQKVAHAGELNDLRQKRQQLRDAVTTSRIRQLQDQVELVLTFTEHLESSVGTIQAAVDDLAIKTGKLIQQVARLVTDTHESSIRRTIAINIEYELKRAFLAEWFPDAQLSQRTFAETMQLLKVASSDVHPAEDIEGNRMTLAVATALLESEFEAPSNSRQAGKQWEEENKKTAIYYLNKLAQIREMEKSDRLLYRSSAPHLPFPIGPVGGGDNRN
ncbi:uncharacterized protein EV422DRAFT_565127 [Fimicolochytrium jonesii]|uniref:uncharacterized protein n=1 Tax=Fimicolochytrium jonesii TaxID=1396493 RepID=UPI0022FE8587|nr:uncharacterized protein EV422DRAFT_565127 [Fimicolochytrium jonesii]KAI8824435.1 hypothetical protein EV422DRAFT_565127 [Fimicolochytrium jonesii]